MATRFRLKSMVPAMVGLGVALSVSAASAEPPAGKGPENKPGKPAMAKAEGKMAKGAMEKGAEGKMQKGPMGKEGMAKDAMDKGPMDKDAMKKGAMEKGAMEQGEKAGGGMDAPKAPLTPEQLKERVAKRKERIAAHAAMLREKAKGATDEDMKKRLEERAAKLTERAAKLDDATVQSFNERIMKRQETRKDRRDQQVKQLRARWGKRIGLAPAQAELKVHARRVARLNRIKELAQLEGDDITVERVDKLLDKEIKRHEKHMSTIQAMGTKGAGAPGQAAEEKKEMADEATEKAEGKAEEKADEKAEEMDEAEEEAK